MKLFRGGLVFKAHRLLYHSTLGLRVIKKKEVPEGAWNMSNASEKSPSPARKVDIRLPGKRNSNSHGARPVY